MKTDEKYMTEKIEKFTFQIEKFSEKIIELSNLICTDQSIREKVDTIMDFKNKSEDKIMTNGIKIDNIDREFHENIYRIDNILKDSVLYPGVIGGISKFKNFHDFIDYILSELSQGVTIREKSHLDLNTFKSKLDSFSLKIDAITKGSQSYTERCVNNLEKKINSSLDLYNDKITSVRIENNAYSEEMKKVTDDLLKHVNNVTIIKNELFNKFEEQINYIKKENTRVIKCFSGYKEQFYEMKTKFMELSDFIRDVRFKANIKEELNRRDFYNVAKRIGNFKHQKSFINSEPNLIENNVKRRRGSAVNFKTVNDIFIKDNNSDDYKLNFRFSGKELDGESLKKEETVYEKFLRSYQKIDSEKKQININMNDKNNVDKKNDENNNENNSEINNENKNVNGFENNVFKNILKQSEKKHKKRHSHHHNHTHNHSHHHRHRHHSHRKSHHHGHHHQHKKGKHKNEKEKEKGKEEKKENNSIYDKNGEFIQRRRNKRITISMTNNKLNIPLVKLFDLTNDKNDINNYNNLNNNINNDNVNDNYINNNNNKFIRKNQKKLKTHIFSMEMLNKMKKLDNFINFSSSKANKSNSNTSFSSSSSSSSSRSSCSSCSKSSNSSNSDSYSDNSDSSSSYSHSHSHSHSKQNYKKSKNDNKVIKEEDENSNNSQDNKTKIFNKQLNNIEISIKDFSKEEKVTQSDNKTLDKINRISKTEKSLSPIKHCNKNKTLNDNLVIDTQLKLKDNYQNLIITNYQNKDKPHFKNYSNSNRNYNNSYLNQTQKNFFTSDSLKKISLTVEGTNKIVIKPDSKENNKTEKERSINLDFC